MNPIDNTIVKPRTDAATHEDPADTAKTASDLLPGVPKPPSGEISGLTQPGPEEGTMSPPGRLLADVAAFLHRPPAAVATAPAKPANQAYAGMREIQDGIEEDRDLERQQVAAIEQEAEEYGDPDEPEPLAGDEDAQDEDMEPIWDAPGSGEPQRKKGPSQASQLVEIARGRYELFMSEDGRPYGVAQHGANIALPLRGRAGLRPQLARLYADEQRNAVPSQSALADAMTVLEGIAQNAEAQVPHLRVARYQGKIVIDLGTSDGRCVVVGPDGWEAQSRSPVLFRRSGAMKALPDPVKDGDGLEQLRRLLNMGEEDYRLLVGWLVASFIPDLPHPILTFRGEQGTGKSYAAKMVIGLIDPSGAPQRTAPRDIKSWATQAFNSWALCLDNVSMVPDWLSDALCRAVTGDGIVDRALYTDDDVVVLAFRRVLALTTIDAGALAGDLAERLLTLELRLIPDDKRREESELDQSYGDAHGSILAALFDLLAQVLAVLPGVHLDKKPRMADFARVLAAVDKVKGWATLSTYTTASRNAVADVLEGDPFGEAVVKLVSAAGPGGVKYTAKQILEKVGTPDRPPKTWPKDPTRAAGKLKRLAPALRAVGISYDDTERQTEGNRSYLYAMKATSKETGQTETEGRGNSAPAAPAAPASAADQGKRPGADAGANARTTSPSTRMTDDAGAAGAGAGAVQSVAPGVESATDLRVYHWPGAAGAAGAEMRSPSGVVCSECSGWLDPEYAGFGAHPRCLEEESIAA